MKFRSLTGREHLILLTLVAGLVLFFYGKWRFIPAQRELQALLKEAKELDVSVDVASSNLPNPPIGNIQHKKAEQARLEQTLMETKNALTKLEQNFVARDIPEEIYALRMEIAMFADSSGMRLLQDRIEPPRENVSRKGTEGIPADFINSRQIRRIEAETSYEGLTYFLTNLNRLSHSVILLEWEVKRADKDDKKMGEMPLIAALVFAL